jgi:hypothetical protein
MALIFALYVPPTSTNTEVIVITSGRTQCDPRLKVGMS